MTLISTMNIGCGWINNKIIISKNISKHVTNQRYMLCKNSYVLKFGRGKEGMWRPRPNLKEDVTCLIK